MEKIKAEKENCLWFYCQGWRYGEIVKQYSKNRVTVRDCTGRKYIVQSNSMGKWIATSHKDFKGENNLKEKTIGKKKKIRKIKFKKRIKNKTTKRKFRKIIKKSKS